MSEADDLREISYRHNVAPLHFISRHEESYTNTSGFVPRPLTQVEYRALLDYWLIADALQHRGMTQLAEFMDTDVLSAVRSKLGDMLQVNKLIDGTILYDGDTASADVEIITLADAVARGYDRATDYPDEPDDTAWLVLHIKGAAILQLITNVPFSSVNNTGILNLTYYALCCSPVPAPGSLPPGFEPPGTNPPPDANPGQSTFDLDCADNEIWHSAGTNHTSLLINYGISLGLGILNLLPIADQFYDGLSIKSLFDSAIASAKSTLGAVGTVKEISCCYDYALGGLIQFQAFDVDAVHIQSEIWHLKVIRGSAEESIVMPPTDRYGFNGVKVPIKASGTSTTANLTADIYTAENDPHFTIHKWDEVTDVKLYGRCLGTVPAGIDQLFTDSSTTPDLRIGLAQLIIQDTCVKDVPYSIDFSVLSAIPDCWTAELYNGAWHGLQFEGRPGFGGIGNAVTSPYFAAGAYTVQFTLPPTGTLSGDVVTVQAVSHDGTTVLSAVDVPFDNSGEITYSAAVDGSTAPDGLFYVRMLSTGKILKFFSIG